VTIQQFTVTNETETTQTFRVQKSAQELQFNRTGPIAILTMGMALGLPEKISTEITHPVRKRKTQADLIPLSHIAAWAQFGRGPIVETAAATGLADPDFGIPNSGSTAQILTQTRYYLNASGPIEIDQEDQFTVKLSGLVIGCTYRIDAPEMPVIPAYSQQFYKYEESLILGTDREKSIFTAGCVGLIIPNNPLAIERVVMTIQVDETTTKDCTWSLAELLAVQADANPQVAVMNYTSNRANARSTAFVQAGTSDLLVISLNHVRNVEIHNFLGQQVNYTLVSVADRSND
jgi:hypothetical protein